MYSAGIAYIWFYSGASYSFSTISEKELMFTRAVIIIAYFSLNFDFGYPCLTPTHQYLTADYLRHASANYVMISYQNGYDAGMWNWNA